MRGLHVTLLLLLSVILGAPLAAQDLETVKDFQKFFRRYKETAERVEAILALEGIEHAKVVDVLVPVLKDKEPEVVDAAVRVLGQFHERSPVDQLLARLEKEKKEPLRVGILRALALGAYPNPGEPVVECLQDKSWDVRRRAVDVLASTGNAAHAEVLAPLCTDKEAAVRGAAFDGLAALHSDLVRPLATAALDDAAWQVRASAIHALGSVRHRDSIPPLIARMRIEEGRLLADLADALRDLTGRAFGMRTELWERFWSNYGDRYQIPTDEELATLRAAQAARAAEYKPVGQVSYHGIDTPSRSILFVVDVSGSMENEVIDRERFADGDYPSYTRIDIVKTELARTIENLKPYVRFNVIAFATDVRRWKKSLVPANVLGKSSARDWVMRLEPIGGPSAEDLARAGLVGAANLEGGKTNTLGALTAALESDASGGRGGRGGRADDYMVAVDTVFFLSDGKPTTGRFVDPDDILREVRKINELRRVVVHTIALGQFQKTFMKRLAKENGGVFVDLGE